MAEKNAGVYIRPMALGIRAPVPDGIGHPLQDLPISKSAEARYSAHGIWRPRGRFGQYVRTGIVGKNLSMAPAK